MTLGAVLEDSSPDSDSSPLQAGLGLEHLDSDSDSGLLDSDSKANGLGLEAESGSSPCIYSYFHIIFDIIYLNNIF